MHPDNHLLARYLAGEASEPDRRQLEAWLAESPRNRVLLETLQRVWRLEPPAAPAFDAEATVARILSAPGQAAREPQRAQGASVHTVAHTSARTSVPVGLRLFALNSDRYRTAMWRGLAVVATAVVATIVAVVGVTRLGRRSVSLLTPHIYTTQVGQMATVTLDDGTRVTLAPQTTLRVRGSDRRARAVELTGEAYFNVWHSDGAPFVVYTGSIRTRVLGTSFVVRSPGAASRERRVRVAVVTGKVVVAAQTSQHPSAVLTAGHVGFVTDSSAIVGPVGDVAADTAWTEGRLVFHQAPTGEVLDALSRWYGYEFRVADSAVAARNWTIVLSTRSPQEALSTLRVVFDVDLQVDGTVVTLVPRSRSRTPVERRVTPGGMTDELTHIQRENGR